jgi:hypothetical protein
MPAPPAWIRDPVIADKKPWLTADGHCWMPAHKVTRVRYPCNDRAPVSRAELSELFWRVRVPIVSYFEDASSEDANAWLYVCRDGAYSIDKLSANNRSKVRRGLRRFTVGKVSGAEIARLGYPCYVGTHERNGLSTPTSQREFERRWRDRPGSQIEDVFAAVKDGVMGAFLSIRRLGRWAEIVGECSATDQLSDYPNHALMFTVLEHFLARERVESLSYGLSSLRTESRAESLHHFKLSLGYEAIPVKRVVRFHPLIKPVIGPWLAPLADAVERTFPSNRRVRAAAGALKLVLGA